MYIWQTMKFDMWSKYEIFDKMIWYTLDRKQMTMSLWDVYKAMYISKYYVFNPPMVHYITSGGSACLVFADTYFQKSTIFSNKCKKSI